MERAPELDLAENRGLSSIDDHAILEHLKECSETGRVCRPSDTQKCALDISTKLTHFKCLALGENYGGSESNGAATLVTTINHGGRVPVRDPRKTDRLLGQGFRGFEIVRTTNYWQQ